MSESAKQWNTAAWIALLLAVAALSANFVFFLNPPLQSTLPWASLVLAIAALVAFTIALRRAFVQSHIYRGKALSILLSVLTLIFAGASLFVFYHARALPKSAAAPQVGQEVPDFTMADANGQSITLDSLFAPQPGDPASAPKAVLLIFYRGYW
jgi:hypothetical protein